LHAAVAALDLLVAHPSTAPFLARRIIQRLVTSNPSNGYIYRVAKAFTDAGGDLGAMVKAILLDYAARVLEMETSALIIEPDERLGQGVIHCPSVPDRKITVGELAKLRQTNSWGSIAAVESLTRLVRL